MEFVDTTEALYTNILLYGPPKTGKSSASLTAPGRVLHINADKKNATRYLHGKDQEGRIKEPRIDPWEEGKRPVFDLMKEVARSVQQPEVPWDVIVVDPLGELYRRLLEEMTNRARRPTMDQRGNAWTEVERWIGALIDAPVHLVVMAHELGVQKDDNLVVKPFVGSQNASQAGFGLKLAGWVDVIAYTAVIEVEGSEDPEYVAQLRPGKGRDGGARFPQLMEEPFRKVDLAEWYRLAGAHLPEAPKISSTRQSNGKAGKADPVPAAA